MKNSNQPPKNLLGRFRRLLSKSTEEVREKPAPRTGRGYGFRDLVNMGTLQQVMDRILELTGFAIKIIDPDNQLLLSTGCQDVCISFHWKHEKALDACIRNIDNLNSRLSQGEITEHRCDNGLWDVAQPVVVDGRHVATILLAQFFYEDDRPDIDFFEKQAEKYGFVKENYIQAIRNVPVLSRERVRNIMAFYMDFVGTLAELGFARLKQRDEIEERIKTQAVLKDRERSLMTLLENMPGMAYRCKNDPNWTMEFVSQGCLDLTGYMSEDITGNNVIAYSEIIFESDRARVWETIQNRLKPGEHFTLEYRIHTKDGTIKWVWEKGCGIFSESGELSGLEGIILDVTTRITAENILRESEEHYRHLVEHSNDAIFLLYNDKFVVINERFTDLFGYTADEINDGNFKLSELVAKEYLPQLKSRMNPSGDMTDDKFDFVGCSREKKRIYIEASVSYMRYREGTAVLGILRDVSEKRRLEERLAQSQKMESIMTLSGGIAHDFNNILTVVNGHAQMALFKLGNDHPCSRDISAILKAGKRAADLTRQLLAFSRKQLYEPRVLDINDLITGMGSMIRRLVGDDMTIETIISPNAPAIKADPAQVEQILMNIIINARDSINDRMRDGYVGKITIETSRKIIDEDYTKTHPEVIPGDYLVISIKDNGKGMSRDIQNRIFEPFFTTKNRALNTGLGLSTAHGIASQNNGTIRVSSIPDVETTFCVYWPASDEGTLVEARTPPAPVRTRGQEVILFVEDEKAVMDFAANALEELGYEVHPAPDAETAIELSSEGKFVPDVLVTDMIMPGMNGRDLAYRLGEMFPHMAVLFTSGHTEDYIAETGALESDINFIHKPYSIESLSEKIQAVLSG